METHPFADRPASAGESNAVSATVLAAIVGAEVLVVTLAFALVAPVVPIGLLVTALLGLLILADIRMVPVAIGVTTFLVHSEIIGEVFIVSVMGINLYAMDWILIFAGCSYVYHRGTGVIPGGRAGSLSIPLGAFLLMLPVFAGVGIAYGHSLQNAAADARLFFYYVSYFVVAGTVRDRSTLAMAFWCVLLMGAAAAIPEIVWSLSNPQIDRLTGKLLAFGRITGASEVTYPMMLAAAVVAYPYMDSFPKRIALGLVAAISAVALFLSYWRGSWLAAGLGIAISLMLYGSSGGRRGGALRSIIGGAVIASAIFGILELSGVFTFEDLVNRLALISFRQVDVSSLQRVIEWVEAWDLFLEHPVLGAGFGYTYTFFAPGVGNLKQVFLHNSYMYVLSKAGIVGLSLFAAIFIRALAVSKKTAKRLDGGPVAGYFLSFCAMLIVLMLKSLTTWHLNSLTTSLFVGMILGIIAGRFPESPEKP